MPIAGHHLHGSWDLPVKSQFPVCRCFCLLFLSSPVSVPLLFLSFSVRSCSFVPQCSLSPTPCPFLYTSLPPPLHFCFLDPPVPLPSEVPQCLLSVCASV